MTQRKKRFFTGLVLITACVLPTKCMELPQATVTVTPNSTIQSLRSLALASLVRGLTNHDALSNTTYCKVAKALIRAPLDQSIEDDISDALLQTQASFAVPVGIKKNWKDFFSVIPGPNSHVIAFFDEISKVDLHDSVTGTMLAKYRHKNTTDIDWHPHREELAIIHDIALVFLTPQGKKINKIAHGMKGITHLRPGALRWHINGKQIICCSEKQLKVFDYQTESCLHTCNFTCRSCPYPAMDQLSSAGSIERALASVGCSECKPVDSADNDITLNKQKTFRCQITYENGKTKLMVYSCDEQNTLQYTWISPYYIDDSAWSYDGQFLSWIFSINDEKKTYLFLYNTCNQSNTLYICRDYLPDPILEWDCSKPRLLVASQKGNGSAFLYDVINQKLLLSLKPNKGENRGISFLPKDSMITQKTHLGNHLCYTMYDLSLIIPSQELSSRDRLMGILAMTERYARLSSHKRSKIGFEAVISDKLLRKKIKQNLTLEDVTQKQQARACRDVTTALF